MNILCVDIGGGTQDICYFTGEDSFENSLKMVLPSPSKYISQTMSRIEGDIFIAGGIIGGGSFLDIVKKYVSQGRNVFITAEAAKTLRDDPDKVRKTGAVIVEEVLNPNIIFDEFDYEIISFAAKKVLGNFEPDVIAAAAQDHGFIKGQSDRRTRFDFLKSFLKNGLRDAYFSNRNDIPPMFSRWRSLAASITAKSPQASLSITDTAVVAALGAASVTSHRPVITVDAGNCHTFAAALGEGDEVYGFFEHHTHLLNPASVGNLLEKLAWGDMTSSEIYDNDGHGAHIFQKIDITGCPVLVTGPGREKLFSSESGVIFANPKGDTMMTGPLGLLIQSGADV